MIHNLKSNMKERKEDILGSKHKIIEKYKAVYREKDCYSRFHKIRKRNIQSYLIVALLMVIFICAHINTSFTSKEIVRLNRPGVDEKILKLPVEVEGTYKDFTMHKTDTISVYPKFLREEEKKLRIETCKKKLPEIILGENKDLHNINSKLNLISEDRETKTLISWTVDRDDLVDAGGNINVLSVHENIPITITGKIEIEDISDTVFIQATLVESNSHNAILEGIERNIDAAIGSINARKDMYVSEEEVFLPTETENGMKLNWKMSVSRDYYIIFLLALLMMILIYKNRYASVDKEIMRIKAGISQDFPSFISKLVLLMNAGVVFRTAIEKIADGYENAAAHSASLHSKENNKKMLYEELVIMKKNMKTNHTLLEKELVEFSNRIKINELTRFTIMAQNHLKKGTDIVEKLELENELLWYNRKKYAEELGRVAETKLTFPLMILLIILIAITLAPAMIGI